MFRSGSALVALNVTVQDDGSKYVGGLYTADGIATTNVAHNVGGQPR